MTIDPAYLNSVLAAAESGHHADGLTEQVRHVLHWIAMCISVAGVGVLVWGVFTGVILFIKTEAMSIKSEVHEDERERLRHHLGYYLLLGLEVLIAADIIESISAPSTDALILLGGVVVIRTVISVSLNWELDKDKRNRLALLSKPSRPGASRPTPTTQTTEPGDG